MRIRPWSIGLFMVVGFGLFTLILFEIGDREKAFNKHVELYSEFSNLSGLTDGAKVRVSGLVAGEILKIAIPASPSAKFRLKLQVEEKVHGMIRSDSLVSIETEGIVGDKFISIKKGSDQAEEARPGSTLPSKEPFEIADLMDKGSVLLNDVKGSLKDIQRRADTALDSVTRTVDHTDSLILEVRPNVNRIANDAREITGKVATLVTDVDEGNGTVGLLLKDEATKQQLRTTIANTQSASARMNETVVDFQSRDLPAKTQRTLENAQSITGQLNTAVQSMLAPDNMGEDGASNLRETLSNVNRGTANLAEDTEALKHEFFFRGFFKKRGFYNLDEVTPKEYLTACEQKKIAGPRLWLQASSLVETDANGQEILSQAGRLSIDDQVALLVDSLPGHLIIIEGYSQGGSPERQFVTSRRRAYLVRRYLETHYHLRHDDIGIVPLRNQPPQTSGRAAWDGAAIMLLHVKSTR